MCLEIILVDPRPMHKLCSVQHRGVADWPNGDYTCNGSKLGIDGVLLFNLSCMRT